MLTASTTMPAMASPFTNFIAPSIDPNSCDSRASAARRRRASLWSMWPARSSASIDICLPGIASSVKRAATFGPLRYDDELDHRQDQEHDRADHEVTGDDEVAERMDHLTRVAAQQDEPGRRHLQRQAEQRGQQQQRRKRRDLQRVADV